MTFTQVWIATGAIVALVAAIAWLQQRSAAPPRQNNDGKP